MVEIAGWCVLFIEVEASIFRLYERGYDHAQIWRFIWMRVVVAKLTSPV